MKKFFLIVSILCFCLSVSAEPSVTYHKNMPEGTFRAKRNGEIVHYDKKGKKIGVYKAASRKYQRVK